MIDEATEQHSELVLIIDDDQAIATALGRLVRTIGFHSRTYASAEALLLEIGNVLPICIITDIQMPHMNGLDLVKELVKRGVKVPVMVMTAYPSLANRELALHVGASEYMTKPLDVGRLEAWLAKVTSKPISL